MNMLHCGGSDRSCSSGGGSSSSSTRTRTFVGTAVVTMANMQICKATSASSSLSKNSLNRLLHLLTLWIWLFCINFGVGKF